jgi:ATP-dependent exoDNAse (exonuclease V) beta subunit
MSEFHASVAYSASAGSGKTYALTLRYLSLLLMGAHPSKILTLTFTNKAAHEMKLRIVQSITNPSKEMLVSLSEQTGLEAWVIEQRLRAVHHTIASAKLSIMTIDSFFSEILKKFSLHAGISQSFSIQTHASSQVEAHFLKACRSKGLYELLLKFAHLEKKRLSSIFELFETIYEKDAQISPFQTPKEKQFDAKRAYEKFLAFRARIFAHKGLSASVKKELESIKVFEEFIGKNFIKKPSLAEHRNYKKYVLADPMVDTLFLELKAEAREFFDAKEQRTLSDLFLLYQAYKRAKKSYIHQHNRLSFNDVTGMVYELLRNDIDSEFLYFRLDSTLQHILIDEYQDTSVVQFRILEPLISEAVSGLGSEAFKSLFFVGDTKQSIYRFRGGTKELFAHTVREFGATKMQLDTNYRSKKAVVDFVNDTFEPLIEGYSEQKAINRGGCVEVERASDIVEAVVEKIGYLLAQGIDAQQIAILTFVNKDSFVIKEALQEKLEGVRVTTETTKRLSSNRSVKMVFQMVQYLYFGDKLYHDNFLALLGEEVAIRPLNISQPLPTLIAEIIKTYRIYDHDMDLLKLIEVSEHYGDIESFIHEFEESDAESAVQQSSGIRILTIHKSKGLEFKHVIMTDRLGHKAGERGLLLYRYEDIHLVDIKTRFANRDAVDAAYAKALEAERELSRIDNVNGLYVGCTRAKESLHILQKEASSAFEPLGLDTVQRGRLEAEPPTLHKRVEEHAPGFNEIDYGRQSEVVKKETSQGEDFAAINYGLAMHYMLEMAGDFSDEALQDAQALMHNRYGIYIDAQQQEEIANKVKSLIRHERFQQIIDAKIYKEQPLVYQGEIKRLDLMCEHDDAVYIVDYKSGKRGREKHSKQIREYKRALHAIYDKKIIGYLCYITDKEIEFIEV